MKNLLLLLCYLKVTSAVLYKLSDDEYDLMPPIFKADPFDSCLKDPRGVYCSTYLSYVSDEDSPLLHMMQEFSAHIPTHYNHSQARYGVCITKRCNHLYKGETKKDLTTVLEACLNETLWKEYKLKAEITELISCSIEEEQVEIQWPFIIVAGVCMCIAILNIIGSIYDICNLKKESGLVSRLLLCFSISRNWKDLTAPPDTMSDPKFRILKSLNGYRAISMMYVVSAHSVMASFMISGSPKFLESIYSSYGLLMVSNAIRLMMQTFFIMSAFLLVYNHLLWAEKHQVTWSLLPAAILKRWLRLTPPYALVLAVTSTWSRYFGSGPFWEEAVSRESRACESEWWHHILYFNNYVDWSLCGPQNWYLAADTQLYVVGITVFIVCRAVSPKKVLPILFVIGVIIPALHTYFQDLDGILVISPASITSFFTTDPTFNYVYKRGHTNLAGSVVGFAAGYLVYHLQRTNFDLSQYKLYRPLYWLMFPLCLMMTAFCKVYYGDYPRFGILHRALVAAVLGPLFAVFIAFILIGAILKYETVYRGILEWNGWTTLSRISYSAYLVHLPIIRNLAGQHMELTPGYFYVVIQSLVCALTLSYFASYIFWLTVEAPVSNVVSIGIERFSKTDTTIKDKINVEAK